MPYAIKKTAYIEKLEELIDAEFEMISVPVRVDKSAKLKNCYTNVARKVESSGGRIQYGWAIVENELMCEAVHHAVWENKQGELVDITPRVNQVSEILFIPDDRIIYDGRNIDNVRMNTTQNTVVNDFIAVTEFVELVLANGNRISDDRIQFDKIQKTLYDKYKLLGETLIQFILTGNGPSSNCFCKSDKSYQACHGLELSEMIKEDKPKQPNSIIRLQTGAQ